MTDNPREEPAAAVRHSEHAGSAEPAERPDPTAPRRIRRPNRFVGDAAGALLIALAIGVLGGVTWGMVRPTQKVTFLEGGRLAVGHADVDATFAALMWFTGIALVAGLVLGAIAHRRFPRSRGLGMEAWAGLSALAMAAVQMVVGDVIAGWRQPDLAAVAPGTALEVLPAFEVPVALLVAPFAAMLAYWCMLFLAPGEEPPVDDGGGSADRRRG